MALPMLRHINTSIRYLSKGCSQYFCTKESDKALGPDRKSAEHAKKGPLKDPMLDDAKYFNKLDDGLRKLGMSDSVSMLPLLLYDV